MPQIKHQKINIRHNPKYQRSGIKSYVWLLQKYSITPTLEGPYFRQKAVHQQGKFAHHHHGLHKHSDAVGGRTSLSQSVLQKRTDAATGGTGEVSAEDQQNDSEYLCEVSIGTPPQNALLDFDTGSSDLWLFSTSLPKATQTTLKSAGHNIFDPTKSSTWKALSGSTWQISYGDGSSASGTVGTDTLHLGGIDVENQGIELASKAAQAFTEGVGDGLLGLAMPSINTVTPKPVPTPVANMITQGDIPKSAELFTAYLGSWRDANEPDKGQSFYTFGYIDQPTLQAANVTEPYYVDLVNQDTRGFWEFPSTTYSINGKTANRTAAQSGGNTAIADTGTTLALVDDATCKAIYAAIPGSKYDSTQQGYVFPTNTSVDKLPQVAFAVGGQLFNVQKEDLLFADAGNGTTYGGIQSRGDMTFDILGDTFLKGIYAIFDQGNSRFGAVQRTEQTQNLAAPQS